jgi:hypothetical protein
VQHIHKDNIYYLRIDKGEEVVNSLKAFCQKESIKSGIVSGIGATDDAVLGFFDTKTKKYAEKSFTAGYEISNITGNISEMNGEVYLHLHASLCDKHFQAFGGHLSKAVISGTCELTIITTELKIGRQYDEEVGLNLYKL